MQSGKYWLYFCFWHMENHHCPDTSASLQPGHWGTALHRLCLISVLATSICTLSSSPGEGRRGEGRVGVRSCGQCLFGRWRGDLQSSWHLLPGAALLCSSLGWKWQADRGGMWGIEGRGGRCVRWAKRGEWGAGQCGWHVTLGPWYPAEADCIPFSTATHSASALGVRVQVTLFCLVWQAWSLGDRFLVSDFAISSCSLSTPWLTRNERVSQNSFPGTLLGSKNSRMSSSYAYSTVNALYMAP